MKPLTNLRAQLAAGEFEFTQHALKRVVERNIAAQFNRKNAGNLFSGRGGTLTDAGKQVRDSSDFDLITWLVIKAPD